MESNVRVLNGRYRLVERAGSGGMAIVYKAEDQLLGRIVAIKVLQESLTDDAAFLARFRQEAHAAANLTHPNIVTVHDIGQDGHTHYIVMEFVDGRTLKQVVREQALAGHPMAVNRALDLTIQICSGIGYAHRAALVHCDVKPQNVLVSRDERVKVADFGIARAISQAGVEHDEIVWGTPLYFAPEQAAGQPATPASDVYSIGIILFELLTGRLPFRAETPEALALKHLRDAPPAVSRLNPAVPDQLERIVAKVLAKEPHGRYRTAGQLGRILATYRQSTHFAPAYHRPGAPVAAPVAVTVPVARPPRPNPSPATNRPAPSAASEQPTLAYAGPPPRAPQPASPKPETPSVYGYRDDAGELDWLAIGLSLIALGALLGLIPAWYFAYLRWTSLLGG